MALRDLFRARVLEQPAPPLPAVLSAPPAASRAWLAAAPSRLLADLPSGAMASPNREIRISLGILRARARWLAQNDGFSKGFFRLLRRNIVGPSGFRLQMAVKTDRGDGEDADANRRLEAAWFAWCQVGACDVTGRLSLTDVCRLLITSIARDGEALVRLVRGPRFGPHGFALQVLDAAQLDEGMNAAEGTAWAGVKLPAGHTIRSGVQLDGYARPVAYWLRTSLPGDDAQRVGLVTYTQVPAEDMLHLYVTDWPGAQARGVPWLEAAIRSLAMLDGYAEAELTAARVGASKMGFYEQAEGEDIDGELQADGTLVQNAEAGTFELLPKGVTLKAFNPEHPNSAFKQFCSSILRNAAAGTGVSYNAFANDTEGLSFSAMRGTALEDRDEYRTIQDWFMGAALRPIFAAWLKEMLIGGTSGLPAGKYAKFNAPRFIPRGWQWVDPATEMQAASSAVALRIKSRSQIVAEQGGDFTETIADLKREEVQMEGLPAMVLPGASAPASAPGAAATSSTSKEPAK